MRFRENLAWQRRGPIGYRLVKLFWLVIMLALAYLSPIVVTTLMSFYQGTGSVGAYGPSERAVQVTVESCRRVGPLSEQGCGYWWVCRVLVPTSGQGEVEAVVDRSIATKDDVGRTIELLEACSDPPTAHCRYGKAASAGWQIYAGSLRIIGLGLVFVLLVSSCFYLLAAILGAPRYLVVYDWWQRKMGKRRQ